MPEPCAYDCHLDAVYDRFFLIYTDYESRDRKCLDSLNFEFLQKAH